MLTRQAKVLSAAQIKAVILYLETTRNPVRNKLIFLLSIKAGLRAKEISSITWSMVCDAEGQLMDCLRLEDRASKGRSGGVIPLARELRLALMDWRSLCLNAPTAATIVTTERSKRTSAQVIVNLFQDWYRQLGFEGCSSHSGRRTFITSVTRKISSVGGSMRDVQHLARHSSLTMTQRYVDSNAQAQKLVVDLV